MEDNNIEVDMAGYSEQRIQEIMESDNSLVVTVAVPGIDKNFFDTNVNINPGVKVQSGKGGCNPFTIALAIKMMEETIADFRSKEMVQVAEMLLNAGLRDTGSVKIDLDNKEVTRHDANSNT